MVDDVHPAVARLGYSVLAEVRKRFIDRLAACAEKGRQRRLAEVDVAEAVGFLEEQFGDLFPHRPMHEANDPPLGRLELGKTGNEPAHRDPGVLEQDRQQPRSFHAEGGYRPDSSR